MSRASLERHSIADTRPIGRQERKAGHSARVAERAKSGCTAVVVMGALGVFTSVHAQTASTSSGSSAASDELGEVVVTAERRSESISKVPIAIEALDNSKLAEDTVVKETDLQALVPGLTVKATGSQNQLNYSIRGQTLDAFSGSSPGVLAYVNDVQLSSQTANALYDLDSVQVLKGPQGTLFGRNATGGAVLYSTAMPGDTFGGNATVRVGNYDLTQYQAAVDIPLVSNVLTMRLAGNVTEQNGFVTNLHDGTRLGDTDIKSERVTVKYTPIEGLTDTTVFQYGYYGGTNLVGELQTVYPVGSKGPTGIPLNDTAAAVYGAAIENYLGTEATRGPGEADLPFTSPPYRAQTRYLENTAEYDISSDLKLKNIVSVTGSNTRTTEILSGSPFGVLDLIVPSDHTGVLFGISQWSEEAQILGTTAAGRLNYIIGFYAASEKDTNIVPVTVGFGLPTPLEAFFYNYDNKDDTKAVYAQGTYDLSALTTVQGLSFTAGGRYTWEDLSLSQTPGSLFYGLPSQSMSESKPSWQFGLQEQLNSDLLLYAVTRGSWRAGNFNGTTAPINNQNQFNAETAHDFELGIKFNGSLLDHATRVNMSLYEQIVDDVQRDVYFIVDGAPASFTHNVPQARVRGVEGEGEIKLTDWLTVGANFAYTNAVYTKPTVSLYGTTITFQDYQDTPLNSGSVFADVTLPTPGAWGKMVVHADAYAQTHTYYSSLDYSLVPGTGLNGYGLVNMRFDWRKVFGSSVSVGAFVKNLTNQEYYVGGYALGGNVGLDTHIPGSPRMFGADINIAF
jgi:iron complex outermembrane recepter protein